METEESNTQTTKEEEPPPSEDVKMEETTKPEAAEEVPTDPTVEAALQAAQIETEALATATAIANAAAIPALDPALPTPRDVKLGDENHPATILLHDLILLHKVLGTTDTVQELATKLTALFLEGSQYQLSGLKGVPRPFLVGNGRIFAKKDNDFVQLEQEAARERLVETIESHFKVLDQIPGSAAMDKDILEAFDQQFRNKPATTATATTTTTTNEDEPEGEGEETKEDDNKEATTTEPPAENGGTTAPAISPHAAPRPSDVLFLPTSLSSEENAPYDHQTGNKHLLYLASQNVAVDTKEAAMRVQIALKLLTSKTEVNENGETVAKQPRYVLQQIVDNQSTWKELEAVELAEFATVFVFEVYLEKQIHGTAVVSVPDTLKASTVPLEQPTVHDVLFGRGGMTNGHPGNRRFRDIIALHRPDYIRATKMDKPKVARRIVKAIRHGNPPGRFLKKADDGKWYDVGDRCAAEKTSQGLRERSNAEKRQRSAMREALRIRKEDLSDSNKKQKTDSDLPLSLSMKEKKAKPVKKATEGEMSTEDLPPNAVDKDGNILVTDHDILCGRGGLTNHHKGNRRFRDIVALHRPDYVRAPKIQKPSVARVIVRAIRNGDPPGRFLKKDKKTGMWYDIGDKRAAEKTSQALREKTREEKDESLFAEASAADDPAPVLPIPAAEGEEKQEVEEAAATEDSKTEETKEDAGQKVKTEEEKGETGAGATALVEI